MLDGTGALLSALCLGLLLPALQPHIGMPLWVLYVLALLALSLTFYSFGHFLFSDHTRPRGLRGLISLNLSYCLCSFYFMCRYWAALSIWGVAYFLTEKLVILALVYLEWRILQSLENSEER